MTSLLIFSICSLMTVRALAERPVRGYYEVPMDGPLKEFSTYPVKFKADEYSTNPNTVNFPLPATLVGEQLFVKMTKMSGSTNAWSGPNIDGTCDLIDRTFTCNVKFNNLQIDPIKVQAAVQSNFSNPAEMAARLKVAERFGVEPIGIIRYVLRGRDVEN